MKYLDRPYFCLQFSKINGFFLDAVYNEGSCNSSHSCNIHTKIHSLQSNAWILGEACFRRWVNSAIHSCTIITWARLEMLAESYDSTPKEWYSWTAGARYTQDTNGHVTTVEYPLASKAIHLHADGHLVQFAQVTTIQLLSSPYYLVATLSSCWLINPLCTSIPSWVRMILVVRLPLYEYC